MNASRLLLVMVVAYTFLGCQKNGISDLDNILSDLTNTQWQIENVRVKATNNVDSYPKNLNPFEISFQSEGEFGIRGGCNYHYGNYSTGKGNTIKFSDLGPGTYLYCPELIDWELLIVWGLEKASTYKSNGARLAIEDERHVFYFQRVP